jgi:hypothetical protein
MSLPKPINLRIGARIALESAIRQEISSYIKYIELARDERLAIATGKIAELNSITEAREVALKEIEKSLRKRQDAEEAIWSESEDFSDDSFRSLPLSMRIEKSLSPVDSNTLIGLVAELKKIVIVARNEAKEQEQITFFARQLLHGILTLSFSQTRPPLNHYGPTGKINSTEKALSDPHHVPLRRV